MRSFPVILALLSTVPTFAFAQDDAAACTTLVVIQSQGCSVRRVFVCDDAPEDLRNVGNYGPDGVTGLSIHNSDGRTLRTSAGPGTPSVIPGEQTDPLSLRVALSTGVDSFNYQMVHETAGVAVISGQLMTAGELVTIDGHTLQVLLSDQTTITPAGETQIAAVRYLYDATLQLLITDTIANAATGEVMVLRTPVDFIWPGEAGFEDCAPLFGCEG